MPDRTPHAPSPPSPPRPRKAPAAHREIVAFRLPPAVKAAAAARAAVEGRTLTDVVEAALRRYGNGKPRAAKP